MNGKRHILNRLIPNYSFEHKFVQTLPVKAFYIDTGDIMRVTTRSAHAHRTWLPLSATYARVQQASWQDFKAAKEDFL